MSEFNPWEVALTTEEASREVANRVEQMKKLYEETILLARSFDLRVEFYFDLPDEAKGGHNQDLYGMWSASAASC